MSVSTGDPDLAVLISGGKEFANRIEELSKVKEAADKSLSDLKIGESVVAARDQVARELARAKEQRDVEMAALETEVTNARNGLNLWVEETKAKIMADYNAAAAALADANAKQEEAARAVAEANKTMVEAKKQAAVLFNDAQAAAAETVANAKTAADAIAAEAAKIDKKAREALAEAEESKLKYDTAMERIKSAMV
jgi:hypothetical protein